MPYKDFAVGEVLTSADVDLYLMSQVIIRCTSATRPGSPAQGWFIFETDTSRLMMYDGTSWREASMIVQPYAVAIRTTNQSINSHSDTPISFNSVTTNSSMWASSPNPTRITIPSGKGGMYAICGYVPIEGNSSGPRRQAFIKVNGTDVARQVGNVSGGYGDTCRLSVSAIQSLSAGDYIELWCYQDSGVSLSVESVSHPSFHLSVQRIGPS